MEHKNYITPLGYQTLKDEIHELVTKERPHLVQVIAWAAGNGDRSENADYIYGKRRLRELDKRIYMLTKKVEAAEVVNYSVHIGNNQIFFGALVTVLRNSTVTQQFRIVGQDEINPTLGFISWISPLARLLLRRNVGDMVSFNSPIGVDILEIIDVNYN